MKPLFFYGILFLSLSSLYSCTLLEGPEDLYSNEVYPCYEFCTQATQLCASTYPSQSECIELCNTWDPGLPHQSMGNHLSCRQIQLQEEHQSLDTCNAIAPEPDTGPCQQNDENNFMCWNACQSARSICKDQLNELCDWNCYRESFGIDMCCQIQVLSESQDLSMCPTIGHYVNEECSKKSYKLVIDEIGFSEREQNKVNIEIEFVNTHQFPLPLNDLVGIVQLEYQDRAQARSYYAKAITYPEASTFTPIPTMCSSFLEESSIILENKKPYVLTFSLNVEKLDRLKGFSMWLLLAAESLDDFASYTSNTENENSDNDETDNADDENSDVYKPFDIDAFSSDKAFYMVQSISLEEMGLGEEQLNDIYNAPQRSICFSLEEHQWKLCPNNLGELNPPPPGQ